MTYDGQGFGLSRLRTATYIESLDMSGPKLILMFNDTDGTMVDLIGFKEHAEVLEVEFSDPLERDSTNFKERFIIENLKEAANGGLQVSCLAEVVSKVKRKADKTTIYAAGSPLKAIKAITGADVQGSSFPAGPEFHLLADMRPSKLLRNIASEIGARIFYLRGTWYAVSIDDLFKATPYKTLTHNKAKSYNAITSVINLGDQKVIGEVGRARHSGWSMTKGLISEGKGRSFPTGIDNKASLIAMGRLLVPQLEFQIPVDADTEITPKTVLDMEWHRQGNPEAPINESMPERVLVGSIAHHFDGSRLRQRVVTLKEVK